MKMFKFAAGLAVGYVLGSRAGREKYEQIVAVARKAQNHPVTTRLQRQTSALLGTATDAAAEAANPSPADTQGTAAAADPFPRPTPRRPKASSVPTATIDPLP